MIIGLGYKARVGKDTTADHLVRRYGFIKTAFAESLKNAVREIFHLTPDQLYGDRKEVVDDFWNRTPRYILQRVGTECMREQYSEDIWVNSLHRRIFERPDDNWVITDVRFPNEVRAVKSWGGLAIRIDRSGAGATGGIAEHASETSLDECDDWDAVIQNDGTFEQLYERVDEVVKRVAL